MNKESMNDVSIIIPVYNTEEGALRRALESAKRQAYLKEILIIDDGSKSHSVELLDQIAAGSSEVVRVIHKVNGGVSSARNVGIRAARGRYIAFLDADDVLSDFFTKEARAIAEESAVPLVLGNIEYHYIGGKKTDMCRSVSDTEPVVLRGNEVTALQGSLFNRDSMLRVGLTPAMYVSNCAALYNRELISGIEFDEKLSISEDRIFNYSVFGRCDSAALSGETWYHYYQNEVSASQSLRPHAKEELEATALSIERLLEDCPDLIKPDIQRGIEECLRQTIDFTVFRQGFGEFFKESPTEYIREVINLPVYRRLFKKYSPRTVKGEILKYLVNHSHPSAIYYIFKIYKNLNRIR